MAEKKFCAINNTDLQRGVNLSASCTRGDSRESTSEQNSRSRPTVITCRSGMLVRHRGERKEVNGLWRHASFVTGTLCLTTPSNDQLSLSLACFLAGPGGWRTDYSFSSFSSFWSFSLLCSGAGNGTTWAATTVASACVLQAE